MMKKLKIREAKGVKREGFNKRELTLFRHSELGSESIPCCKLTVLTGKILKPSWIMRLCPKAWFWASYGFRFAHPTANPLQDDSYDNSHNEPLTPHPSPLTNGAGQRAPLFGWMAHGHVAFTMAEILLSLTIIGVVAAITLPSLTGNINERTWNTQRKALYSRMSQAISLMPALNGYGTLNNTTDTAAETFITSGLSKVLKINNICDNNNLSDCGLPAQIINGETSKMDLPKEIVSLNNGIVNWNGGASAIIVKNAKAAAFETINGESILTFYNPNCTAADMIIMANGGMSTGGYEMSGQIIKQQVCANFIYDLNGKKGPNTVGKDIGIMSVIYSTDSKVVMPMYPKVLSGNKKYSDASKVCRELDQGQYRLPNIEELISIYYNKELVGSISFGTVNYLWSATSVDSSNAWLLGGISGMKYSDLKTNEYGVLCVER